ncbi:MULTISPECIES: helix-turn-helix transcriptional regulator [Fusobacterium]|uniref:helix-turn-helix domain-containing protein n=1 Tax=Fusobacterium TaxID=848 RepID=UPI002921E46D|nr:hypothetical protein AUSP0054_00056 [uncultured phage]
MKFGEVLKKIRIKNGDSLRRLGEKIDNNFSYIDKVEKGTAPISKNLFEKLIKTYPMERTELITAYCKEVLPDEIKKKLGLEIENDFLDDVFSMVSNMDKESKKAIITNIIDRMEFVSLKNGSYENVKKMLEEARNKTEKL